MYRSWAAGVFLQPLSSTTLSRAHSTKRPSAYLQGPSIASLKMCKLTPASLEREQLMMA